jgi:plastocyanin
MANEQPAGPIEHLIPVQCNLAESTLELALALVGVKPGDRVIWQFFGLSESWSPWIELQPGASFLGPFTSLTQSGTAVWGTLSEDQPLDGTSFVYRAVIQKGQGTAWETGAASIHSSAGSLVLTSAEAGTTQRFTVTRQDNALRVSPLGVIITASDTVEWDFAGLDEAVTPDMAAWRPVVAFHHYDGKGEVSDLDLGPFTSLTTASRLVRGMGNNHVAGTYYFQVSAIRISDGAVIWISSPDPAIDNRGGVGDPTGGG